MDPITVFQLPQRDQSDSFLFNYLPGEVRDKIFTFALNCYENPRKLWNKDTPYVRPGHAAAQVADIALLQTCQRIYAENWFRPWISATHTFYLTLAQRRPDEDQTTTIADFQPRLDQLFAAHGEVDISHVQVFAQMYNLEPPKSALIPILSMRNFFPRKLTVTIRHHDWWHWESDRRLKIDGHWIQVCRFPDSLKEVCVELESLQRKKDQIDWIADEMVKHWHLRKADGTIMSASKEDCKISNWSGSSIWEGVRWVRDEAKPAVNEYYVKTVTWRPSKESTDRPVPKDLRAPDSFPVLSGTRTNVSIFNMKGAGVPADLPAEETVRRVQDWERQNSRHNFDHDAFALDPPFSELSDDQDDDDDEGY